MKKWTKEEIERLVPESTKIKRMLNCLYFNIGSRVFVASQPDGHILLQTRMDLETARKHIEEHYTGAATGYIKELESEITRLRGALERLAEYDYLGNPTNSAAEALKNPS